MSEAVESPRAGISGRGQASRTQLIDATVVCVAEYGIAGASVERIAAEAGVSRGLIRHHFGGKGHLVLEAFQALAEEFRQILDGPAVDRSTCTARDEMRELIANTFSEPVFDPNRLHAWFGFWDAARTDPDLQELTHAVYMETRTRYRELFAAIAREEAIELDDDRAGKTLAALADGVWLEILTNPAGFSPAEAIDICESFVDIAIANARLAQSAPGDG